MNGRLCVNGRPCVSSCLFPTMQKDQTTSIMTCSVEVSPTPASTIQGLMQGLTFMQALAFLPLQCFYDYSAM